MTKRNLRWAVIGMIAAGCQSPSATPVPPPAPAPVAVPSPATRASVDPRVAKAMRQAELQAQALKEATFEPPPGVTPAAQTPPAPPPPAPSKPAPPPPAGGGLKPVQSIEKLIESGVIFEPASDTPKVTVAPPAEVTAPPVVVAPPPVVAPSIAAPPVANVPGEIGRRLDAKAQAAPRDFSAQFDAEVARLLGDQPPVPGALQALDPEDGDLLRGIVDGLVNFRAQIRRDPNALPTRKIQPLLDMADRLRAKADLAIVNPSMVTRVRGFGSYEPINPLRLPAGVAHKPALYYEIENFSSRIDAQNMYRTNLRQDVYIYDAGGSVVWSWRNEPVTDICRRQRHDLYFAKIVRDPILLAAGTYTIKITLTEAQRVAEISLPLVITPPAGAGVPPAGPPGPVGPGGVR